MQRLRARAIIILVALVVALLSPQAVRAQGVGGGPVITPLVPAASHSAALTPLAVYAIAAPVCVAASPIIGTIILQREMTAAEVARSTLTCILGPVGLLIGPQLFPDAIAVAPGSGGSPPRIRNRFALRRGETRFVPDEVLVGVAPGTPQRYVDTVIRRLNVSVIEARPFSLTGRAVQRWRIPAGRSVPGILAALSRYSRISAAQPNYLFSLAQTASSQAPPPMQYIVGKLRLDEVHRLSNGDTVRVAIIDAAVDRRHPDLAGAIIDTFDAVGSPFTPHPHGTGMAGAIGAHARLTGVAPSARLLAIRAFDSNSASADGTTFNILKGLDWAAAQTAQIINMSFAGPADPLIGEMLKRADARGIVLVAAVGNAGPRSAPLYPAAYPEVIGVTAIDAEDRLFALANRGPQVAIAAPGVDILVPAPDGGYQVTSGTSVAAAHISGMAALMLARNPSLRPKDIRRILTQTAARTAGSKSRDFGAGLADPLKAVTASRP